MATAVQVESLWNGLTDNNGQPLAAGKVYTYSAGTTTPVSLFTASDKSTSATNPLILDGNGKAQVWADGRYKFVVKTSADVTLYTLDNLLYGFDDTTVLYGGTSTGSANAQVVSVPATVTSYANGQTVSFVAGFTNTGATTLQFNSLSAVNLVKGPTPSSLQSGDLIAGQLYTATYHGGAFRLQDYPSVADVQRSRYEYAASVSGTNTITATLTPAPNAYETGMLVRLIAAGANTAAVTLNLNSLGVKTVQRQGTALVGGEIKAGDVLELLYDGTQFQLLNFDSSPLLLNKTTNQITSVSSGSASAPAFCPGNDLDTGMYSAGANYLAFSVNGVRRFYSTGGAFAVESNIASGYAMVVGNADTGVNSYGLIVDGAKNPYALAVRDNTNTYRHIWNADGSFTIGGSANALNCNALGDIMINKPLANITTAGVHFTKSGNAANPASMVMVKTVSGLVNSIVNYYAGAYVGGMDFDNTTTYFPAPSDYRLKENVVPLSGALTRLNQLNPVRFNFIAEPDKTVDGFIAHEVATVVPNAVLGEKDAVKEDGSMKIQSLDQSKLVPLLVGALQELSAKVVVLEARVSQLETAEVQA